MTIATTRAALIRDNLAQDGFGDEIPTPTIVAGYEDFPISIIEADVDEFDRASGEWRTVHKLTARPTSGVCPARDGDRLQDLRNATIYTVDEVRRMPRGLSGRASVTMHLSVTNPVNG